MKSKHGAFARTGDALVLIVLYVFLVTEVMAGPLRYYLSEAGAAWLIYLPKGLIVTALLGILLAKLYLARISGLTFGVALLFAVYVGIGAWFTESLVQPAFGAFSLLPLIYAMHTEPALIRFGERILSYVGVLWFAAAVGVAADYFWDLPWTGVGYQLLDAEVESSREWTTFGIERLAGFARASFEAADQLLLLSLPLVVLARWKTIKLVIWVAAGVLIILTTTKKTIAVYALLTVLLPIVSFGIFPSLMKRLFSVGLPILVAAIGIGLPVSALLIDYRLNLDSLVSQVLFASLEDRLTVVWPASFALALEHGSALFGRGIGGIGAAQNYFELWRYMPGDNLYLYLYVTFGIFTFVFIAIYVARIIRLTPEADPWDRVVWLTGVAILMSGWATNCIESPLIATLIGITFAYAYRHSKRTAMPDHLILSRRRISLIRAIAIRPPTSRGVQR